MRKTTASVRRITVDEWLDEDLLRLEVADLVDGVEDLLADDPYAWTRERDVLVRSADYLATLGLNHRPRLRTTIVKELTGEPPGRDARDKVWRRLAEGQVFLVGRFTVVGKRKAPKSIRAGGKDYDALRIDRISAVKAIHKARYARTLPDGREVRDAADQEG